MGTSQNRSYEKIEKADLTRLIGLAKKCLDEMLARTTTGRFYSSNDALMACLCQGAARHFVHGDRGVNDWDVVFFFRTNPDWKFPPRWKGNCDFGPSRFGTNPDHGPRYSGRRIDVLGRDIPVSGGISAEQAIVTYLQKSGTVSAREWAKRPLIALTSQEMLGQLIWDHPEN
jgi:hypothetical protein